MGGSLYFFVCPAFFFFLLLGTALTTSGVTNHPGPSPLHWVGQCITLGFFSEVSSPEILNA